LRYVAPLRWDEGKMRIVFPMVVGPRYIPGTQALDHTGTGWASDTDAVADASRVTPVVRNPESRSGHDISLTVDLDSGFHVASVTCVSHAVNVHRLSDGWQQIELASGATLPNKDFILEVQQAESTQARAALFLSPANDSAETQFLLAAFPPAVRLSHRMPVEMLYMIDVSGSIGGTSIE
jgi:Ca-activated chloride channel family protein